MSTTATSPQTPAAEQKSRLSPTKKLPTFRVGYPKQMDALRALASLSDGGTKGVHYKQIAEVISIHEANVSSMNPFFLENGFIERRDNGYAPTAPVLEYYRQYQWNAASAPLKLEPIIANSWFVQALVHRLQFRSMTEDQAIEVLAAECSAGPEAKPQLRILLDFCEGSGLISRGDGKISLSRPIAAKPLPPSFPPVPEVVEPKQAPEEAAPKPASSGFTSTIIDTPSKAGAINMQISIQVDLADMQSWSPERITAFFGGIAQVLAAKGKDS